MPPVLRRFHGLRAGGRAAGTMAVQGGEGPLRHAVARLLRLPSGGMSTPVRLQVVPQGSSEVWIRHFGNQCVTTRQWQEGNLLVEQAGPLHFIFRVTATPAGLLFAFGGNRLLGARLPASASLSVAAIATASEDGWNIDVQMLAPLLGVVTSYSGEIHPLW